MTHPFLTRKKDIIAWLDKYHIKNYFLNAHELYGYTVSVFGSVLLSQKQLTHIAVKFDYVYGYFDCSHNNITSLEGCPKFVENTFDCSYNQLSSLQHAPLEVKRDFICSYNQLTSLIDGPQHIYGNIECCHNLLVNLIGMPKRVGSIYASHNRLKHLDGISSYISGIIDVSDNQLDFPLPDFLNDTRIIYIALLDNPLLKEYQRLFKIEELKIVNEKIKMQHILNDNTKIHKIKKI